MPSSSREKPRRTLPIIYLVAKTPPPFLQVHAEWLEPQSMVLCGTAGGKVGIKLSVESRVITVFSTEPHLEMK